MNKDKPKILILAGPTASGKTGLAIELARRFDCEIVSADSIQIYRYMNVGSAKPTHEELAQAPHHMIDIRDPDQEFSAGDYLREARKVVIDIMERGKVPLVVGGTGLYIRTLTGGIAEIPPADYELRQRLRNLEESEGAGSLFEKLSVLDPDAAERIPAQNLTRIVRALEIITLTGRTYSELRREHSFADRPYNQLYFCLNPDRSLLYERIDKRVDNMIKGGLLEEVNDLYKRGYTRELKSMQSLGYRHATMVLSGEASLDEAVNLMKRDTRRYAKRQFTWFRSEPEVLWMAPEEIDGIGLVVANFLGR